MNKYKSNFYDKNYYKICTYNIMYIMQPITIYNEACTSRSSFGEE